MIILQEVVTFPFDREVHKDLLEHYSELALLVSQTQSKLKEHFQHRITIEKV
jgi:hypothetical protein